MDSSQAQRILLLYRPGGPEAADPEVRQALEVVARDPELSLWFERHCAFQRLMQERLRTMPVPMEFPLLRALPAPQVSNAWWRNPAYLAAAAALALLLAGLAVFWLQPPKEARLVGFQERMVRTILREYRMELATTDLGQIRAFLGQNGGPSDYTLTAPLEKLPGAGCGVLKWRGNPVSMICFDLGGNLPPEKRTLWLFVLEAAKLPDPPRSNQPSFSQVSKLTTATWSAGGKTYLLASWEGEATLRKYL